MKTVERLAKKEYVTVRTLPVFKPVDVSELYRSGERPRAVYKASKESALTISTLTPSASCVM